MASEADVAFYANVNTLDMVALSLNKPPAKPARFRRGSVTSMANRASTLFYTTIGLLMRINTSSTRNVAELGRPQDLVESAFASRSWIPRVSRRRAPSRLRRASWGAVAALLVAGVTARAENVVLTGDLGYVGQVVGQLAAGSQVDARSALFRVANSGTLKPSNEMPCDLGRLPINRYPLQIRESPGVTLRGGLFAGEVPLLSDWRSTYCNSTAAALRGSPGAVLEDLRIRQVWDAVRMSEGANNFLLRGSWVSEARDDCIENDYLNGGVVEDMLLDGCFSGFSMRPPKGEIRNPLDGSLVLRGVLMRMQSYLYKEQLQQGPPFKVEETGPEIEVYDSIVAMGDVNIVSKSRLSIGWARIGRCSGNLLLWTAGTPWPDDFAKPPACFRIVEGAEAEVLWQKARHNWIDCHPNIVRFAEDQPSDPRACDVGTYGGQMLRNKF